MERFVQDDIRNEIGSLWWWSGRKILPWLQKDYIWRTFSSYTPLTDHEDDLPYDVDHICPQKDWGDDWRNVQRRFDNVSVDLSDRMYKGRDAVGNGIGNLRLIELSENRRDHDADISVKMSFVLRDNVPSDCDARAMTNWAFPPEDRALWSRVARPIVAERGRWDGARLEAFQQAVERRASWLYRRFHDELGYLEWTFITESDRAAD